MKPTLEQRLRRIEEKVASNDRFNEAGTDGPEPAELKLYEEFDYNIKVLYENTFRKVKKLNFSVGWRIKERLTRSLINLADHIT